MLTAINNCSTVAISIPAAANWLFFSRKGLAARYNPQNTNPNDSNPAPTKSRCFRSRKNENAVTTLASPIIPNIGARTCSGFFR